MTVHGLTQRMTAMAARAASRAAIAVIRCVRPCTVMRRPPAAELVASVTRGARADEDGRRARAAQSGECGEDRRRRADLGDECVDGTGAPCGAPVSCTL